MNIVYDRGEYIDEQVLLGMIDQLEDIEARPPLEAIAERPQEKQRELLKACGVLDWFESNGRSPPKRAITSVIGYGGAVYGGKTFGLLLLGAICCLAFPGVQVCFFRRTYAEMTGPGAVITHDAPMVLGKVAHRRDDGREYQFPNGSAFYFRHCEHEDDVHKYHGAQIDILLSDEATSFTWYMIDYLLTRNRISGNNGLPRAFAVLCANPGLIGHTWYMQIFDLEDKKNKEGKNHYVNLLHVLSPNDKYMTTFFIPSYMRDNPIGLERDPEYPDRLRQREGGLADALENGDWDIFSGQMFNEFSKSKHVCKPFDLPYKWPKWRAVDWGWAEPYVCLWLARNPDNGRIYIYREHSGAGLTDKQQAESIITYSPAIEALSMTFADPSMWTKKNYSGVISSSADEYLKYGVPLVKGDNERVAGIKKIHNLLAPLPDGKPGLIMFENCAELIRTLPKLSRDERNVEDIAGKQEDHWFDCLRYGLSNVNMFVSARKKKSEGKPYNPWNRIKGI